MYDTSTIGIFSSMPNSVDPDPNYHAGFGFPNTTNLFVQIILKEKSNKNSWLWKNTGKVKQNTGPERFEAKSQTNAITKNILSQKENTLSEKLKGKVKQIMI